MKKLLIFLSLIIVGVAANAQDFLTKSKVSGSFEINSQYYIADDGIGITKDTLNDMYLRLNGFGKIQYSLGDFTAGMRFEAFQPELSGFRPELRGSGVANYFATYDNGIIGITVGDVYDQFGSGLVFRTYEEWSLGYDNSLRGMRAVYRPVDGVTLKGVYGKQRYYWASYGSEEPRGIVRGVDGEWDLNQSITAMNESKFKVGLGGSFVSNYQASAADDPMYNVPVNVAAAAGRINLGYGRFAFTTEYAYKINNPSAINRMIYKNGEALLSSLSYSQRGLGVVLQVKRVDNMSFKSDYTATRNDLDINFIPPINYTHTHSLPAMYSYSTQPNGEMGVQFQVNYLIPKKTVLGGKYGTKLTFNYSQVNDIVRDSITYKGQQVVNRPGTLGYKSPFFGVSDKVFYRDINFEIDKKINKSWSFIAQYINLVYDMPTIEGHGTTVKVDIAFLDLTYKINPKHSVRMELQHLWDCIGKGYEVEEGDEKSFVKRGNWFSALLEYTIAPRWFVSVADKYNYGNPVADFRDHYYTASVGFVKDATRITLSGGRQSEGMICVGGVCRVVPASSGVSLTIATSF
jgi:hypothetical protein